MHGPCPISSSSALFSHIRELPLRGYRLCLISLCPLTDTVSLVQRDFPFSSSPSPSLPTIMPSEEINPADVPLPARCFMQGNDIQAMMPMQRHLIYSMRAIEIDLASNTSVTPEELRLLVAGDISPALLFDPEVSQFGPIYRHLRDWLRDRGLDMVGTSRRIPYQLADTLYRDSPDADAGRELSRGIVSARRGGGIGGAGSKANASAEGPTTQVVAATQPYPRDRAHDMGMRFRGDDLKFLGTPQQALHEYLANYQQVSKDYKLTAEQQLLYLHNLFGGAAKRYYDLHVDGNANSIQEAITQMNEEYNTPIRQSDIKNRLAGLRVSAFVAAGMTARAALEAVRDTISRLSPQMAPIHRAEQHLVEFLRGAVVGEPWADGPIERMATEKPTFQRLFLQLDASLGLKEEGRVAVTRDASVNEQIATATPKGTVPVMYAGQGMYAYPNRAVGATSTRPRPSSSTPLTTARAGGSSTVGGTRPRFDPLSVAGCFNCDDPAHTLRHCPLPVDTIKAAQRKLAYYDKKNSGGRGGAATVLYLMCNQHDRSSSAGTDREAVSLPVSESSTLHNAEDTQLFETLLLSDGRMGDDCNIKVGGDGSDLMGASTSTVAGNASGFAEGE